MGHENRNRGKESNDDKLFNEVQLLKLKEALRDHSHLLTRGYGQKSSVQLVGNRYRLNVRQQQALMNMGASEEQVIFRNSKSVTPLLLENQKLAIDGFNLLIIMESILSNAYIFKGKDGFYRDISSVYGSYKRVSQSEKGALSIGYYLEKQKVKSVLWVLDKPVSNSGRLKTFLKEIASANNWDWEVILENNPDKVLAECNDIVVTSDAWILDRAERNFNLISEIISEQDDNVIDVL